MRTLEELASEYAEKHGFRVPYDGGNEFYDRVDVKASYEGFIAGFNAAAEAVSNSCNENSVGTDKYQDEIESISAEIDGLL